MHMARRLGRHATSADSDLPHVNRSQNTHQSGTVKQDQVSNAIRVAYTKHPNRVSRTTSHPNTRDEGQAVHVCHCGKTYMRATNLYRQKISSKH
ncbi:hypothetical protein DPMN_096165 [Dreissena polymorpha]|uniref:Uncharacterized protein n=1 Tax=Dreissena polymorpha TaxID=45954 RepID=A0A9D4R485_DREPO|nr:hypothetical protein DPMN_096165 [Dreissena polymorpha]